MGDVSARPRVAVITVTHNSSHVIERWLEALEGTGHRDEMELCVVDSGSSAAEQEFLSRRVQQRVEVLCTRPNLGFGGCCNVGAEHTRAPVLLFTNPDTMVRSLPEGLWRGDEGEGRVLGALKQLPEGGLRSLGFDREPTALIEAQKLVVGRVRESIERTTQAPKWVSGAALMIPRADFEGLQGFSPDLFMYFEDADLCLRHRAAGGSVAVDGGFLVEHGSGKSSVVENTELLAGALESINRQSARTFAARHGAPWQRVFLYALLALVYVPRRCAALLLGRGEGRGRIGSFALDLLAPRRALRRLGVADPSSSAERTVEAP
jgi:GT2 family glycosyltransferase